jgi:hypothetical protein
METSGPLNTEGSFMSFQVYKSRVDPMYLSNPNCSAHHARTWGAVKSKYEEEPGLRRNDIIVGVHKTDRPSIDAHTKRSMTSGRTQTTRRFRREKCKDERKLLNLLHR